MPKTTQTTSTDPIQVLQTEISDYEAEIQKLQHQLTELRPSPPPPADATPSELTAALLQGATELQTLQARSGSIKGAIASLENVVRNKEFELDALVREEQQAQARSHLAQGVDQIRVVQSKIDVKIQQLIDLFLELKVLDAEYGPSYRMLNPSANNPQQLVNLSQPLYFPRLLGEDQFYSTSVALDLYEAEKAARAAEEASRWAKLQTDWDRQAQEQKARTTAAQIESRRQRLKTEIDYQQTQLDDILKLRAKHIEMGGPVNTNNFDHAIAAARSEIAALQKEMRSLMG